MTSCIGHGEDLGTVKGKMAGNERDRKKKKIIIIIIINKTDRQKINFN
jgi:hypothetical protein